MLLGHRKHYFFSTMLWCQIIKSEKLGRKMKVSMKYVRSLCFAVGACVFLSGCSASVVMVGPAGPRANVDNVEVLYQEPERKNQTIAMINHMAQTRFSSLDSVLYTCREEAAKVGADALVVRSMKGAWTGMGGASVEARAVRWLE